MIDTSFWNGKRVFLTGHTGFKGSWLAIWLHELGARVTGYSLDPPTNPSLFEKAGVSGLLVDIRGDVRDKDALAKAIERSDPEIVFHLAAQPIVRESYKDPIGTFAINAIGTANLLDCLRGSKSARAFLNVTTDKVYENREWCWGYRENEALGGYDPYSASKACSEIVTASYRSSFFNPADYGKTHSLAVATARAGNVIGGGDWAKDRLVPDIIQAFIAGERVLIRNPDSIRPWQHVLEPVSGYLLLTERLCANGGIFAEAWNFGPNESDSRPVKWIVEKLCDSWAPSVGFVLDKNPQPHEASYLKLDCSKALSRLGWAPRWNLEKALEKIVEWNRAYLRGDDVLETTRRQISEFAS